MDLTKEETEEGCVADETEGCGEEIFTGEHHPLAISSTSTKRPPPEPPPPVVMTTRKGRLKLQHFSILQKTEFGLLPLDLSLERPPRKPPDEVRITLLPPISSLSRPPPKPPWSGCCKPSNDCGFTYQNPTNWTKPASGTYTNPDCDAWTNDPKVLCFNCQSCKAGLLDNLKTNWKKVAVVNIIFLIFLIIVYSIGCCAFRNNRRDGWKRY